MNRRHQGWVNAISKAIGGALTEGEQDAVAKVVADIHWDAMEEAAVICEDNGDEASADDIHNMQDSTALTMRQEAIVETLETAATVAEEYSSDAAQAIRSLIP